MQPDGREGRAQLVGHRVDEALGAARLLELAPDAAQEQREAGPQGEHQHGGHPEEAPRLPAEVRLESAGVQGHLHGAVVELLLLVGLEAQLAHELQLDVVVRARAAYVARRQEGLGAAQGQLGLLARDLAEEPVGIDQEALNQAEALVEGLQAGRALLLGHLALVVEVERAPRGDDARRSVLLQEELDVEVREVELDLALAPDGIALPEAVPVITLTPVDGDRRQGVVQGLDALEPRRPAQPAVALVAGDEALHSVGELVPQGRRPRARVRAQEQVHRGLGAARAVVAEPGQDLPRTADALEGRGAQGQVVVEGQVVAQRVLGGEDRAVLVEGAPGLALEQRVQAALDRGQEAARRVLGADGDVVEALPVLAVELVPQETAQHQGRQNQEQGVERKGGAASPQLNQR